MKKALLPPLLLALLLVATAACGGGEGDGAAADEDLTYDSNNPDHDAADDAQAPEPGTPESYAEALKGITEAFGGNVEPVDFRELREMLPDEVEGAEQTNVSGERSGAAGFNFSQTSADYVTDDGTVELQIVDMGTASGMAALGYSWLQVDIDRENANGYERTGEYEGFPSHEKMERRGDGSYSELQVLVGERFLVSAQGDVEMDVLKDALDEVNLRRLERMKDVGRDQES